MRTTSKRNENARKRNYFDYPISPVELVVTSKIVKAPPSCGLSRTRVFYHETQFVFRC